MGRVKPWAGLGAWAAASLIAPALANEGITPFQSGITTGVPLGSLAPPGFYADNDNYFVNGYIKNGQGRKLPVYSDTFEMGVSLLWSTPYKVLGARYSADFIELLAAPRVDARRSGGADTRSIGGFNPIINPLNLSWDLSNGWFVSSGQSFYLPVGDTHVVNGARYQTSYANGYFTYEPNAAITYLKDGWNLTANNVIDFNAKNNHTHYKSGDAYYIDLTAVRKIDDVTFGVIGNYTIQFQNDRHEGVVVGDGIRAEHLPIGPLIAYDFGRFNVTARYLRDLRTRNDIAISIVHIDIAWKF